MADQIEEIVNVGSNHSSGWAQQQPDRLREHGVIDIGPQDQVRDPTVDITNLDESRITPSRFPGDAPIVYDNVLRRDQLIWERLVNPESGIELAAREIAYLLNMLKKGSPYTKNPWALSLLKNPEEGIDIDDIYANLKMGATQYARRKQQIELEKTLAILAVSAYNGAGAIYTVEDKNAIFSINENPWAPGSEFTPEGKKRGLYQPRVHAVNAAEEFSERLLESTCIKEDSQEEFPPPPSVNRQYRDTCINIAFS